MFLSCRAVIRPLPEDSIYHSDLGTILDSGFAVSVVLHLGTCIRYIKGPTFYGRLQSG